MKKLSVNTKNDFSIKEVATSKSNNKLLVNKKSPNQGEEIESDYWEDEQNLGLPTDVNFRKLMGCGG